MTEQAKQLEELLRRCDSSVYHIVRSVSRTGATRYVSFYVKDYGIGMYNVSESIAQVLNLTYDAVRGAIMVDNHPHPESVGKYIVFDVAKALGMELQQQRMT